jgi:hypothetical protein
LTVDGAALPLQSAAFVVDDEVTPFERVSAEAPMTLAMDRALTVVVDGQPLAAGKHTIGLGFVVTGMGEMRFDVTDAIEVTADA